MTKIFVAGLCPLPFENTLRSFGPGIRSWQFAHSLAADGHEVHLVAMQIPGAYEDTEVVRQEVVDGVTIERLEDSEFFDGHTVAARVHEFAPQALVGATMYGSFVLAKCETDLPLWADQFGHVMAEAQAKAKLEELNWPLAHFWNLLEPILHRADKMSTVSTRQSFAAIGELGVAGRLTWETCGYEFIATIPCALVPQKPKNVQPILRGSTIPEDAFIVLWSGGYNVWSDVDTLFHALELAMEENSRIHFVSTGGEIGGHDETTYHRFVELIDQSPNKARYHLQGWVRAELVPSYQAEADLGVLTEIPIYEGRLGHKNRIVQWMGGGLPVAYNVVGDLGGLLRDRQLGLTFEVGHAEGLAEKIVWASHHGDALEAMAKEARTYTEQELTFHATTHMLRTWVELPQRAPDAEVRRSVRRLEDFAPPTEASAKPPSALTRWLDTLSATWRRWTQRADPSD